MCPLSPWLEGVFKLSNKYKEIKGTCNKYWQSETGENKKKNVIWTGKLEENL